MKITIDSIKEAIEPQNWQLLSTEYQNLDEELIFLCDEGHKVMSSWRKMRTKLICPICADNEYKKQNTKVVPKKKESHRILALDQATKVSGFAIFDDDKLIRYGKYSSNSKDDRIVRINEITNWAQQLVLSWEPDEVIIEDIQLQQDGSDYHMNVQVFKTLAQLQGAIINMCYQQKVPISIVLSSVWRSALEVTGRTRADKKKSAQLKIKAIYDVSVTNDEADAICLGHYAIRQNFHKVNMLQW